MPRHATPSRRCCRGEVPRRWRNLISRLMSLLIAHPSPRRLFIGADRDRPSSCRFFLYERSSSLRFLLFNLQDGREEGRGERKKNIDPLGRGREGTKKGSIDRHVSSVKNRDADTSLVFPSCHCTTCSYIFQRRTSNIPACIVRVYRSLLTSDRCGDPRVQVSSIVTGVDTVSLLLDDLSSLRDPRLLLSAAKHNRRVSHLRAS